MLFYIGLLSQQLDLTSLLEQMPFCLLPDFQVTNTPQVVGSLNSKRYQQKHSHIISTNDVSQPNLTTHIGISE